MCVYCSALINTCCTVMNHTFMFITFRVRHSRGEMYRPSGHGRLCDSVCLSPIALPHYCMDPDVTRTNGRWCPLVVHYWADLQSVHGFHCHDNIHVCRLSLHTLQMHIAPNAKYQRILVLALCLVLFIYCARWQHNLKYTNKTQYRHKHKNYKNPHRNRVYTNEL